jgi:tRNA splicing ligase
LRRILARPIGALVTGKRCSKQQADQFVGYVKMGEEEFEKRLHDMGFHRNPLSYWKKVSKKLGGEEGSWRKVEDEWQLHLILYKDDEHDEERTYLYAHWEYRWDVHPIKHLRGKKINVTKGVNEMRRELLLANIEWYSDQSTW